MSVEEHVNQIDAQTPDANPLGLFIAFIREHGSLSERECRRQFREMALSSDYAPFTEAIVDQWIAIKYSTAFAAANPPRVRDLRAMAATRKSRLLEERAATDRAKQIIGSRLLDLLLPNGKRICEATGAECTRAGGFYAKIARRVKAHQIVGKILTEDDLQQILKG